MSVAHPNLCFLSQPHMSATARVLVIDDAPDLLAELVDFLEFCGFDTQGAGSVAEMRSVLAGERWRKGTGPAVLALDLGLPDGDGLAVARELRREHGLQLGIVMMTARGHLEARITGLEAGADAYLPKPVAPRELRAVIEALAARLAAAAPAAEAAASASGAGQGVGAGWRIDPATLRLIGPSGMPFALTGAEARLLTALFEARGEIIDRDRLCRHLGHSASLDDTRRLDSLISRLRSKVEQQGGVELPLQTFRNLGYAFTDAIANDRRAQPRAAEGAAR
jgi:DNA-binding response OmpR family regulator